MQQRRPSPWSSSVGISSWLRRRRLEVTWSDGVVAKARSIIELHHEERSLSVGRV